MHGLAFPAAGQAETTGREHFQHCQVAGQNLRDQLAEPGLSSDCGEVAQQGRTDTSSLVLVDHGESQFGLTWLRDDITPPTNDDLSAIIVQCGDQGHVAGEIDVQEERYFLLREVSFWAEEAPVE